MEALFGPTLTGKSGDISTLQALEGKVVGLYFSAHWCPPCKGFTPVLAGIYNDLIKSKNLEIVFVSSDKDQGAFDGYHSEMPWLALPFADRERKEALSSKYKVQGIPTLVFIDEEGNLITTEGREAVSKDPKGENFPWKPKPFSELIGTQLRKSDGTMVPVADIQGKNVALYFSAHWCPPCRAFTPKLAELYKTMKATEREDFEFIFISSDKDETSFNSYHGEQPWLALPFDRRSEKEELSSRYGVQGIPSLVVVDSDGKVINKNARAAASEDMETGAQFPWYPKKMEELSSTVSCNGFDINEKTAVVVLADGCSEEVKEGIKTSLLAVATELSMGEDPDLIFFTALEHAGPVVQVKGLLKLPEELVDTPMILILDIPDKGGYYIDKEVGPISVESINRTISKYKAKELTRGQLS